jgi:hypothetical protein
MVVIFVYVFLLLGILGGGGMGQSSYVNQYYDVSRNFLFFTMNKISNNVNSSHLE